MPRKRKVSNAKVEPREARSVPFNLSADESVSLALLIQPDGEIPNHVILQLQEKIRSARFRSFMKTDSRHTATEAGGAILRRLEGLLFEASDILRGVLRHETEAESEAYRFLLKTDFPPSSETLIGQLSIEFNHARELHDLQIRREWHERSRGTPTKMVPFILAYELAPIWDTWSGRKLSHNGPWGRFIKAVFDLTEIDASPVDMARKAAEDFAAAKSAEENGKPSPIPRPSRWRKKGKKYPRTG